MTILDRFMAKVKTADGCWVWQGSRTARGYGNFVMDGRRSSRKYVKAHRASWILFRGQIPSGKWVCHKCDNPPCVNPEHLFVGTPTDNFADMKAKGRSPKRGGMRASRRKLDEADVARIRSLHGTASHRVLAAEFGVNQSTIQRILAGTRWKADIKQLHAEL